MKGVVKRIVSGRGFGFIETSEGKDIFFHCSGVIGKFEDLSPGVGVVFEVEKDKKGPRAVQVELSLIN